LASCIQTGRITLSSGKVTDFYFDGRLVTLDPEGSVLVGKLILEELIARGITAVGGLTSGADPITSSVGVLAWQRQVPMHLFFVRKERKGHGTGRRIEGPPLVAGAAGGTPRVALVDDVLTTGNSLLIARDAVVEEIGLRPQLACVVVDREEGGRERLQREGIDLVSLFRRSDFC
jgi:orotate phosphoribosyltransferase